MNVRGRRWVVLLLLAFSLAVQAPAQTDPESDFESDPSASGTSISIPRPEARDQDPEKYEIPELAGASTARGSYLVGGELPRPVLHYIVRLPRVLQRMTIFENGLVVVHVDNGGASIRKQLVLPMDAVATYRTHISPAALELIQDDGQDRGLSSGRGVIRSYRDDGTFVERSFDPTLVLRAELSQKKIIMDDLLRALAEDREVSNPLTGYRPKLGDVLVADDQKSYKITRIIDGGTVVELTCTSDPLKMYVSSKDLYNYFIGKRRKTEPQ